MNSVFTFYNSTSAPPDSFDPLDFDAANNVFLGRMLYSTPVEFDSAGVLSSSILDEFHYDATSHILTFKIKKGAFFEDGSPITAEDLAMSIKRMAFFRPQFPVIEKIRGLRTWRSQDRALANLPQGIQVDGLSVRIQFSEDIEHPLFRFTLELFAVVPSSWINLDDGKMHNGKPPESGRYRLTKGELGKPDWAFQSRNLKANVPVDFNIRFRTWHEAADIHDETPHCIGGFGEVYLDGMVTNKLSKAGYKFIATPSAWHMVMKLNSLEGGFRDLELRRSFISHLRGEMAKRYPTGVQMEESIFTRLLEGYTSYQTAVRLPISEELKNKYKLAFPDGLVWIGKDMRLSAIDESIVTTCEHFGITCTKLTRAEAKSRHYDLFVGLTGFWSYDPYGDIKMLFTPNLHAQLQDIAKDKKIQDSLTKLNDAKYSDKAQLAKELDRYIHDSYIYNVVAHFPFVFAYSDADATGSGIPQSGTLPYPWMLVQ